MKKHEIAALAESEMPERIKDAKRQIAEIIFNKAIEPPQNPMAVRNLRRDVARMKTRLRQAELAKEKEAKGAKK